MAQSALVSAERLPTLPSAESLADFIALLPQPLVVTTADGEGRFLLANAAARAIAGIPTPDISAYRSPDCIGDSARGRGVCRLCAALGLGRRDVGERPGVECTNRQPPSGVGDVRGAQG